MSNRRSRELAADLARRAIEAAERRRAEEATGTDAAERLRAAADQDGRLTPEQALDALGGGSPGETFNDLLHSAATASAERNRRDHERIFGPEPTEPT